VALYFRERQDKLAILFVPHPTVMMQNLSNSLSPLRKSWYTIFFQIPMLPEAILRNNDWAYAAGMLRQSGKSGSFSDADIEQYRRAWWREHAFTSILNWYRAALQMPPDLTGNMHVHVPTLMLWGANDIALGREMAQPSIELCDHGKLVLFENTSHWIQHDKAAAVNKHLLEFFGASE